MSMNRNLPRWERALRVVAGLALAAAGSFYFKGTAVGWGLAASGIILLATGFIGFCPACAIAGRRIDPHD